MKSVAMTEAVLNRVIRLVIATTATEFESVLAQLPHGVRFGVASELDLVAEAHRYDVAHHCAYYLRRRKDGIAVWRWSCIASFAEAGRLRLLIDSLPKALDIDLAARVFEQATHRSVDNPRPRGLAFPAADFGGYPAPNVASA